MKQKKVPLRKCINCQEQSDKKQLIRIVKTKEGEIFLDKTGKANGRGAYICGKECLEEALSRGALKRAFSMDISKECIQKLREDFEANDKK